MVMSSMSVCCSVGIINICESSGVKSFRFFHELIFHLLQPSDPSIGPHDGAALHDTADILGDGPFGGGELNRALRTYLVGAGSGTF
jgi:hypothetical protein